MLAAVTCYFNPFGNPSREATVAPFVDSIMPALETVDGKLFGVELIWDDSPSVLRTAGVENVIVICNPNAARIFQKEALLNIGIQAALDEGFENVGWFDADCTFSSNAWAYKSIKALERFDIIQPARSIQSDYSEGMQPARPSAAFSRKIGKVHTGGAWIARKELFDIIRLYPHAILGGGDWCVWGAIYNRIKKTALRDSGRFRPSILSNLDFAGDWKEWAEKIPAKIKVGSTEGKISLLNHGARQTRRYMERHKFYRFFNPSRDLFVNSDGVFEWAGSANREFMKVALRYMENRKC